ncbi:MAG: hypothetical protein M5T61_19980 [Acidimicrobiia bacterium]|nr:hypothetical protein [Acidimicrobiia bacterium]
MTLKTDGEVEVIAAIAADTCDYLNEVDAVVRWHEVDGRHCRVAFESLEAVMFIIWSMRDEPIDVRLEVDIDEYLVRRESDTLLGTPVIMHLDIEELLRFAFAALLM